MSLNLLPPQEVKTVKYFFWRRYVIVSTILIIIAEIILIIVLAVMQLFLSREYNEKKKSIENQNKSNETEEIKKAEQKINEFNSYLTRLQEIQKNNINRTEILDLITEQQTTEIKLVSIIFAEDNKKISLKGTAPTREAFMQFKDQLEKTKSFSDFNSPLSNIINATNINFSLSFLIKPEAFQN